MSYEKADYGSCNKEGCSGKYKFIVAGKNQNQVITKCNKCGHRKMQSKIY